MIKVHTKYDIRWVNDLQYIVLQNDPTHYSLAVVKVLLQEYSGNTNMRRPDIPFVEEDP